MNGLRPGNVLGYDSHEAVIGLAADVEAVLVYLNEDDNHIELGEDLVHGRNPLCDGL